MIALDANPAPDSFLLRVVAVVVGGLALGLLGWICTPLKWWWENRKLRKLIEGRREFILVYNPHDNYSKPIVLHDKGQIGEGRNDNEDTWRVKRGCLEFVSDDGRLYSRFKLDRIRGRLAGTADPDVRSLFGQYMFPQY
jgi:hypothetical protein